MLTIINQNLTTILAVLGLINGVYGVFYHFVDLYATDDILGFYKSQKHYKTAEVVYLIGKVIVNISMIIAAIVLISCVIQAETINLIVKIIANISIVITTILLILISIK